MRIQLIGYDSTFMDAVGRFLADPSMAGVAVISYARSFEELMAAPSRNEPDVAIVDLDAPGLSVLDIAAQFRGVSARTPLVALVGDEARWYVKAALNAGVDACVLKEDFARNLMPTILDLVGRSGRAPAPARDPHDS